MVIEFVGIMSQEKIVYLFSHVCKLGFSFTIQVYISKWAAILGEAKVAESLVLFHGRSFAKTVIRGFRHHVPPSLVLPRTH